MKYSLRTFFPILASSFICLFFISCGGGSDPAPEITADAEGNPLQEQLAMMEREAAAYISGVHAVAANGANAVTGSISSLMGVMPQWLNQWSITSNEICHSGPGGIGVPIQQCMDKFWHWWINEQGQKVVGQMATLPPQSQMNVAMAGIQMYQQLGIPVPPEYAAMLDTWIAQYQDDFSTLLINQ